MAKRVIYFDLDRTLINTDQLILDTRKELGKIGVDEEEEAKFHQAYVAQLASSTDFDPQKFITYLAENLSGHPDYKALHQAFFKPDPYILNVYPEVMSVLEQFGADGYTLCLYSEGNYFWQKKKLELSGLADFFSTHDERIFERKTEQKNVEKLIENSWVVDDNHQMIQSMLGYDHPLKVVWLNRNTTQTSHLVPTVFTLSGFQEMVHTAHEQSLTNQRAN